MKKLAVLWSVALLLLTACASVQLGQTSVVKQYHHAVVLGQQADQAFAHPHHLQLDAVKDLLAQLVYVGAAGIANEETPMAVFQSAEIERLAPSLQQALQHASPQQWVRFVSFGQQQGVLFSNSRKTEGVVFIDSDNNVNIAFSYINAKRAPSETSAIYHQFAKLSPLEVAGTETPLVVENAGLHLKKMADGSQACMWLEADMETFEDHLDVEDQYVPVAPPKTTLSLPLNATHKPDRGETSVPAITPRQQQQAIKQQLKFLKSLFEDGLISSKEYEEEKAKVLAKMNQ
ncbi:SHOCT domain-containing protein [Desulfuromonas acetoxidans]|uniref:SHOCT domain-containing protein n=1 Tax=Desulfuromonas acetoxidans TaxID=891 RepID=UPI002931B68F|nr:SHOCT domain-containing protein [Desulfuromonas acetoxidans]